jgi:Amt family ammonium transporter
VWASDGFLFKLGAIDFAGGTVVHISAGMSALVCALYLGGRKGYPNTAMRPNNLVMTMMGAGLLWVGWFGFNAGSSVNSNVDTARALTVTQVAAAGGALSWMLVEALHHRKATSLGLCSGILAGLVAITPAAGVVNVAGALALGMVASVVCYLAVLAKSKLGYDDSLDVFGIHGVAAMLGAIGLAPFLRPATIADLLAKDPAWSTMKQLGVQSASVAIAAGYAALASLVLIVLVDKLIGFRLDTTREMAGMDHSLHGESGYGLLSLD